jgi:hypothetical protein
MTSSFRGSVSALLLPIEQVAYDRGMLRRDSYVIVGADAIMVCRVSSVVYFVIIGIRLEMKMQ